jgi:hypothetical protein
MEDQHDNLDMAETLFLAICETSSQMDRSSVALQKVVESGVLLGAVQSLHTLAQQVERRSLLLASDKGTANESAKVSSRIQPLVSLANTITWDLAIRREIIGTLRHLASDAKVSPHVHTAGALSVLMDIIRDGCSLKGGVGSNDLATTDEVAAAAASDAVLEEVRMPLSMTNQ